MDKINTNEVEQNDVSLMDNEELKNSVHDVVNKVRLQAMLLGAQAVNSVILQKITDFEKKNSKVTMNDYKRLVKDIKSFCVTGLSKKVNNDGSTSEKAEESTES